MTRFKIMTVVLLSLFSGHATVWGDTVFLINGDRITGQVTDQSAQAVVINADAFGTVSIEQRQIDRVEISSTGEKPEPANPVHPAKDNQKVEWKRTASIAYFQTGGNTRNKSFSTKISADRKTDVNEWTNKVEAYYESDNGTMNKKKFYGATRYAFNDEAGSKAYTFFKLEGSQDRFGNIDYRLIPSAGRGYWFKDLDDEKFMLEGSIGYQYTSFRDSTESEGDVVLVPRLYYQKKIWRELTFTEDLTLYPSLENLESFRLRSETSLSHPINERVAWRFSLLEEYDAMPGGDAKKNDYTITAGLDYSF